MSPICTGREDADAASEEEEEEGENFLEFKVGEGIPAIKVRPGRSYIRSIHNTVFPALKKSIKDILDLRIGAYTTCRDSSHQGETMEILLLEYTPHSDFSHQGEAREIL